MYHLNTYPVVVVVPVIPFFSYSLALPFLRRNEFPSLTQLSAELHFSTKNKSRPRLQNFFDFLLLLPTSSVGLFLHRQVF
ncbi:hypothetical protein LI328DRAFT_20811 [Trichoderma asperelloides]|nr:hypothetical protein LI328DRAFT_20811 [Trichoderma asperelloides]